MLQKHMDLIFFFLNVFFGLEKAANDLSQRNNTELFSKSEIIKIELKCPFLSLYQRKGMKNVREVRRILLLFTRISNYQPTPNRN